MRDIARLERRLQTEQDALSGAVQAKNRIAVALYEGHVRRAEKALMDARMEAGEM